MGKHSYEFSNKAQDRLSAFDASKRVQEDEQYWDGLVGNAGKTDFSEDAHQRLLEAQAYHEHRLAMEARDSNYDPLAAAFDRTDADFNQEWDDAIEEDRARDEAREAARIEKLNALDTKIAADPKLRRIQMLSRSIDDLRSQTFTDEDEARKSQMLDAKYVKIEELIRAYENESDLSEDELYELLDRTLTPNDSTSASTAKSAPEASKADEKTEEVKESAESNSKSEESTPLFDELARLYGLNETADNENSLAASADKRALLDDEDDENLAASKENRARLNDDEENLAASAENRARLNDDEDNLAASPELRAMLNDDPEEDNLAASKEKRALLDDDDDENLAASKENRARLNDEEENLAASAENRARLNEDDDEDRETLDHPMTRSERVLAWWNGSRMHDIFEKRRTSKNFNRTAVALGAVVLGAAVASRLGWFHDFGFDPNITPDHHDGTPNPDTGNNGGDHEPQAPKAPESQEKPDAPAPAPTPNPEAILASYEPAFNVPYASGGEDLMKRLGVAPTEWYSKVVPGLLEKYPNDFYPEQVGNYIDIRFDRPGPLPKEIQRDILHRLGKI